MTSKQRRRLSMYLAVRQFLSENKEMTKDIPHYDEYFRSFLCIIEEIGAASEIQLVNIKGRAREKRERQDNLVTITCDYSRKLKTYAKFTSDVALEAKVKISKSDLEDMRDLSLLSMAGVIYNAAESIQGDLSQYRITPETRKEFRKALDQFNESIDSPRLGIVERAKATLQLERLFSEGNSQLQYLDTGLTMIAFREPVFFSQYRSVRKIIHSKTGAK